MPARFVRPRRRCCRLCAALERSGGRTSRASPVLRTALASRFARGCPPLRMTGPYDGPGMASYDAIRYLLSRKLPRPAVWRRRMTGAGGFGLGRMTNPYDALGVCGVSWVTFMGKLLPLLLPRFVTAHLRFYLRFLLAGAHGLGKLGTGEKKRRNAGGVASAGGEGVPPWVPIA